jgi:transaldolase
MRRDLLQTRIFLDSSDPGETAKAFSRLGFLDGQTTDPKLILTNPELRKRAERGEKLTEEKLGGLYRKSVEEISKLVPDGSVSIAVYSATARDMLEQATGIYNWIPNGRIRFPSSPEGLKAAEAAVKQRMRIEIGLCFSQDQAAAAYAATAGAERGMTHVSSPVGILDDRGENGMSLVENIIRMYHAGDAHEEVLVTGIRHLDHLLYAVKLKAAIVSAPLRILEEWADREFPLPGEDYVYPFQNLQPIRYREHNLTRPWHEYDLEHELTAREMEEFSARKLTFVI